MPSAFKGRGLPERALRHIANMWLTTARCGVPRSRPTKGPILHAHRRPEPPARGREPPTAVDATAHGLASRAGFVGIAVELGFHDRLQVSLDDHLDILSAAV
jgi:hypothetical protein